MKVSINETIEVSDEQRSMIADILDAEKTKRQATRDEIKTFIWALGSGWENGLNTAWREEFDNVVAFGGVEPEDEMLGGLSETASDAMVEADDMLGDGSDLL